MKNDLHEIGDQVDAAVEELITLWPALHTAVMRDAGMSGAERVSATVDLHPSFLNQDVSNAIKLLRDEATPTAQDARTVLGEPGDEAPMERTLESIAILYRRLVGRGFNGQARKLADTVFRWQRATRTAIGLSRRTAPLQGDGHPIYCPLHDQPLTVLRKVGDEGTLDITARGDREAIHWLRGSGLYCPYRGCKGAWEPREYPFLGRLVAEQRRRLSEQESA